MEYSVAFKLWLPCGYTGWACQYVVEASNEDDALFEAEMILQRDKEFEGYKIIGNHISEYEKNDEYRFEEKRKLWEAEENNQKAPAEIARALNRIADKMGYLSPAPHPQPIVQDSGIKPYMVVSIICSIASVVSLILSILLR